MIQRVVRDRNNDRGSETSRGGGQEVTTLNGRVRGFGGVEPHCIARTGSRTNLRPASCAPMISESRVRIGWEFVKLILVHRVGLCASIMPPVPGWCSVEIAAIGGIAADESGYKFRARQHGTVCTHRDEQMKWTMAL